MYTEDHCNFLPVLSYWCWAALLRALSGHISGLHFSECTAARGHSKSANQSKANQHNDCTKKGGNDLFHS